MSEIIKGAPLGPRVVSAVPCDGYTLLLTFNNGEKENLTLKCCWIFRYFHRLKTPIFSIP